MPAPDFKYMMSKKYRMWRLLQANPTWVDSYSHLLNKLKPFNSGIVFPEQMFCFKEVYQVSGACAPEMASVVINITTISSPYPVFNGDEYSKYDGFEPIRDLENKSTPSQFRFNNRSSSDFFTYPLFGNKSDAVKYATKVLEKFG